MGEVCPVTGTECAFLSELSKAHATERREDKLTPSKATDMFEHNYAKSLAQAQVDRCAAELCGVAVLANLALEVDALSSTDDEVRRRIIHKNI
jgi:hypothetical protein